MIDTGQWELPSIFALLQRGGGITPEEMARTFNCGIGMAVIVAPDRAAAVSDELERAGEQVFEIGRIEEGPRGCSVRGRAGSWNAGEEWSVTHNA